MIPHRVCLYSESAILILRAHILLTSDAVDDRTSVIHLTYTSDFCLNLMRSLSQYEIERQLNITKAFSLEFSP